MDEGASTEAAGMESEAAALSVALAVDASGRRESTPFWFGTDDEEVVANSPVHRMMDPSLRERMSVDCTPGRDVRCERSAVTCSGTCDCNDS